jgi:hypothetical protein
MRPLFLTLLVSLLAAGCSRADSTSAGAAAATAMPATTTTIRAAAAGSPYGLLRKRLLMDGWLPLHNASCAADTGRPRACNRWLELQQCDNDGRCTVAWGNPAGQEMLKIQLSGMPTPDMTDGRPAELKVTGSQQTPVVAASVPTPHCPSTHFDTFLPAFASQPAVRRAFTAPLVRSNVLVSDAEGDRTETVYVRGDRPDVFDVVYRDGAFHHAGVDGIDPTPLALDIRQPSPSARDVSYLYGSSEGRSFRFTAHDGCWYLTGNPEPTGP